MPNKRHIMIDAITRIIERMSKKSEEQMDVEILSGLLHTFPRFCPPKSNWKTWYVSSGNPEQLEKEDYQNSAKIWSLFMIIDISRVQGYTERTSKESVPQ